MKKDPQQYINLFNHLEHTETVAALKQKLKTQLRNITFNEITASGLKKESR